MREPSVIPVAVIGMACRLPGGIESPEQLWDALLRGDDMVTEVPADRWDVEEFYDPERGVPGRSISRWGGFLDDIAGFDPEFFGLSDKKAIVIDPQHRLLLETSWEAIEHAGLAPESLAGSSTGVFVGQSHEDYVGLSLDTDNYGYTGTAHCMASGRVAYTLAVHGPALTVDTACSSGLLAVHLASRSLQSGESDLALAGGVMVMLEPRKNPWASAMGMLSPTGRCRTFDVAADGFVRSEGCAVVLLKRLPDAIDDGDRILAVIRGTAANSDGHTPTIATPAEDPQVAASQSALAEAAVDADTIGIIEAHGTGTPVGDPIEFASLARVYGTSGKQVLLGSAKSNFGHTESAAGTLALIKAVLELQHGMVPPMVHFTRLPDNLAQIETGLSVPREVTPWPAGYEQTPRRAAVASYGISGTNVHAILEQAPETNTPRDSSARSGTENLMVFPVSSTSAEELRRSSRRLADWLDQRGSELSASDLAYTLACRRGHRPVRTAVLATGLSELAAGLREVADGDTPYLAAAGRDDLGPVWVFSGQGSQWAAMGATLLATEPEFAASVARIEPLIAHESGFSVTEAMSASEPVTGIDRVQPTLFAMQVALAETMTAHGVRPGAVIGHSMGEVAAAVTAGALSLEDGVRVICRRSGLMSRIAGAGAMASVELPAKQVRSQLDAQNITDVVVSVLTSPESTVVGGANRAVRALVEHWESRGVMAREVAVDVASHSSQVDRILDELAATLADLTPRTPTVPFYSTTADDPGAIPAFDAAYWVDNLRQPVRFAGAVQAALADGYRVFGEASPHPLLARAVEQTAKSTDTTVAALAFMRREQPLPHGLLDFLVDLYRAGAAIDFSQLFPDGALVDAPLPTWTHRRLLLDRNGHNHQGSGAHTVVVHPLLGEHVRLPDEEERHAWQGDVGTAALPWLADHRVHNVPALPGAAYCEMALAAARTVLGADAEVRDIRFEAMLLLEDTTPVTALASVDAPGVVNFSVQTELEGEKVVRATATLHAGDDEPDPAQQDIPALLAAHSSRVDGADVRQWLSDCGVQYGPAFTGLAAAHTAQGQGSTVLAEVGLAGPVRAQQNAYGVHAALLDACFQAVAAHPAIRDAGDTGLMLPLSVGSLRLHGSTRHARYCSVRITTADATSAEADLDVLDESGNVLLAVRGLRMGTGLSKAAERDRVLTERLLTIDWQRRESPEPLETATGSWLLVTTSGAGDPLATGLAGTLNSLGAQCETLDWPVDDDHLAAAERLRDGLRTGASRVVVVSPPAPVHPDGQSPERGREQVRHLVRIARELAEFAGESPRLYVVTRGTGSVLPDDRVNLDQAGLRGLLRVLGAEHPQLRPTQIDVDAGVDSALLAGELLSGSDEDETAWRDGQWYTARLRPGQLRPTERRTAVIDHESDGMRVEIRTPGDLATLELVAVDRKKPGPGQIEVAVEASSINFADVRVTFGRYPSFDGRPPQLGLDFAGVVSAVGDDVTDHRVGDRVGGLAGGGCWGTFVTCPAQNAVTLPPDLTAVDAAAVSTAYGTAWQGLHNLARIESGDRVLIHSATGGVGQAAIAIALRAGAEIFATAGSPARRQLLRDMGIDHVYDSRSTDFADQIRRDTDGYGVDIVLNSLTGAAQRAGLELLSFGGRFVEIGKRDVYANTRLGLYPFRRNLEFYCVDLALMGTSHPRKVQTLLSTLYQLVADGELPVPEHTVYPIDQAATAVRTMSAAEHTDKLVLTVPRPGRTDVPVPPQRAKVFRKDGSYIVTGGIGGLGLFLAAVMAAGGCGRIVLSSRSQPSPAAQKTIARLRAHSTDVVVEAGNIAEPDTARRLVQAAIATGLPLRGVLHAAAVVEDATITSITNELIDRDWAPKVFGAWYLHEATAGQPVDWFCSFSSAAALLGSPGQGAYAAPNSWLDGFTDWRRSLGLPATAIAWGAWAEIGRGTGVAQRGDVTMITPEEGAHAFRALLRYDRGNSGYTSATGTPLLTSLAHRSPFAEDFLDAGRTSSHSSDLRAELAQLSEGEWPNRLRRLVADQVSLLLRRPVDPDRPFADHGLDSLGNLELRTHIESETGIRLTTKSILTHNSVRELARHLSETLSTVQT